MLQGPSVVTMMCMVCVTGPQCCYDDVHGVCYRAPVLLRCPSVVTMVCIVLQGPSVVTMVCMVCVTGPQCCYDGVHGVCYRAPALLRWCAWCVLQGPSVVTMVCMVYVTGPQRCYDGVHGVCYRAPVLLRWCAWCMLQGPSVVMMVCVVCVTGPQRRPTLRVNIDERLTRRRVCVKAWDAVADPGCGAPTMTTERLLSRIISTETRRGRRWRCGVCPQAFLLRITFSPCTLLWPSTARFTPLMACRLSCPPAWQPRPLSPKGTSQRPRCMAPWLRRGAAVCTRVPQPSTRLRQFGVLLHRITPPLLHRITPPLPHRITPPLLCRITPPLPHRITPPLLRHITPPPLPVSHHRY